MGTNKMIKRIFLLLIVCTAFVSAQTEYVPVDHKIYNFLERLDVLKIISGFNSFELPKTRHEIATYLKEANEKNAKLHASDRASLEDYKVEFELEYSGTLNNSVSLFGNSDNQTNKDG